MKKLITFFFFLAVFLGVAGLSAFFANHFLVKSSKAVVVPDLTRKDLVYALEALTSLSLNAKLEGFEFSTEVPRNHILLQNPKPGREIKKDRDVRLVLSAGPRTVPVPDLAGLPLREARIMLEQGGLSKGWVSRVHGPYDPETVVGQYPAANAVVSRKTGIDLLVSLGPRDKAFPMPRLLGLSADDAVLEVERLGLAMGRITVQSDPGAVGGQVVNQHPLPGFYVHREGRVDLVVNQARGETQSPGIEGGQTRFVKVSTPPGFLKSRVRLRVEAFGHFVDLFDEWVLPGKDLWLVIPDKASSTFLLYLDGRPVDSKVRRDAPKLSWEPLVTGRVGAPTPPSL